MNSYEEKQLARQQRYLERAEQARREFEDTHDRARTMAEAIPFGQPILVGHHSEKSDRNYRNRIHQTFGKAFQALERADHYENKAAAVGSGGISSDDPDALPKLRAKLESLERHQEMMKAANAAIRRGKTQKERIAALVALGFTDQEALNLIQPDYAGRIGVPPFALSNNNANIHRISERIESLEKQAAREVKEEQNALFTYREDPEENRAMFIFDGKPDENIRAILKSRGFKWSPRRGAWVRQLNNAAIGAADFVKQRIAALREAAQ